MSNIPQPAEKSATKPIYVVTVRNEEDELIYIKSRQDFFNINLSHIDVRGIVITKTIANKLLKQTEIDRSLGEKDKQIHWIIPLNRWIKTDNISFNGLA